MKISVFLLLLCVVPLFSDENILDAIRNDDVTELKSIINNGENPYIKINNKNDSLLHFAVQQNSIECISYLLSLGMDIDYKNAMGETPFMYALKDNKTALIKYFIFKTWPDVFRINLYKYNKVKDYGIDVLKKYNYLYFACVKNEDGTYIYNKTGFNSKKIMRVPCKARVLILKFDGNTLIHNGRIGRWVKAQYGDKTGYFFTGDLEPVSDPNCINAELLAEIPDKLYKVVFDKGAYIESNGGYMYPAITILNPDKNIPYQRIVFGGYYDNYSYRILKIEKIEECGYKIYIEMKNENNGKSPYAVTLGNFEDTFYIEDNKLSDYNGDYVDEENAKKYAQEEVYEEY
ncbi:MAG: ankyrin repeat domain-containing protein [Spirochaetales bacterium]|nr:ankyrin repeat domain-containing protein [Spirochaetales bacterium]